MRSSRDMGAKLQCIGVCDMRCWSHFAVIHVRKASHCHPLWIVVVSAERSKSSKGSPPRTSLRHIGRSVWGMAIVAKWSTVLSTAVKSALNLLQKYGGGKDLKVKTQNLNPKFKQMVDWEGKPCESQQTLAPVQCQRTWVPQLENPFTENGLPPPLLEFKGGWSTGTPCRLV